VSPAPGHSVEISDRPPARIAAADTAAAFMVGLTERGKGDAPVLCRSITHFESQLGARYSTPTLYDAADAYFREGGSILYVVPVLGPSKATATDTIAAASGVALNVFATSPGAWGNDIDVANDTTGGNFVLTVSYLGNVVETSPVLATTADAALALFTSDYGPGQVLAPGRTTTQGYKDLLAHADAFKRVALLDGADTHTVATLTSAASGLNGQTGDRFGGLFAPWAIVPGLAPGTTRTVPYSAIQAGLIARSDAKGANPNVAAAGSNGIPRYAVDLSK
jgi:hypothetical protein